MRPNNAVHIPNLTTIFMYFIKLELNGAFYLASLREGCHGATHTNCMCQASNQCNVNVNYGVN